MKRFQGDLALVPELLPDDAAVKIIGLGGVGGIVARYLSIYLASLHRPLRLFLIDGDVFEAANASRMLFSRHGNKAAVIRDELMSREELGEQCSNFLDVFGAAVAGGNIASIQSADYAPLRALLAKISGSWATAGFPPADTATFVLSLKDALVSCVRTQVADDPAGTADAIVAWN